MRADAAHYRELRDDDDLTAPVLQALALHVAIAGLLWFAGWWQPLPEKVSVAGPVVEAALVISEADIMQAQETAEQAPKPEPVEAEPIPQPEPEPLPQESPEEVQPVPQEMIPEPDTVDQEAVARLAEQAAEDERRKLQEERRRQEQIDLTERERQQEAERRQRKRERLEALRQQHDDAARRAKLEQEKLDQLAEAAARRQPRPSPDERPAAQSGNNGTDTDLQARYMIALNQTANASWNRSLAPEGVPCKVRFRQLPGGEVVDVQFLSCPFNGSARESVERALRRGHMPYEGFESVFEPDIYLTMCYPEEACPR